ncbi:transcriptional repressor of the aga regulon [Gammaproteobacteria bacterium]|nr:transcriptional repressor of the aga regulon [Gammaproteobacteria bacterium]
MPFQQPNSLKRRLQIADLVRRLGEIKVETLSKEFGVSTVTIRNDLSYLEKQGFLTRSFGKARHNFALSVPAIITEQNNIELSAKKFKITDEISLASTAAGMVRDGDTIFLGAGSIIQKMIPFLTEKDNISILINDVSVLSFIQVYLDCAVHLTGGTLAKGCHALLGPLAEASIQMQTINKCFLEIDSIQDNDIVACNHPAMARLYSTAVSFSQNSIGIISTLQSSPEGFPAISLENFDQLIIQQDVSKKEENISKLSGFAINSNTGNTIFNKISLT